MCQRGVGDISEVAQDDPLKICVWVVGLIPNEDQIAHQIRAWESEPEHAAITYAKIVDKFSVASNPDVQETSKTRESLESESLRTYWLTLHVERPLQK